MQIQQNQSKGPAGFQRYVYIEHRFNNQMQALQNHSNGRFSFVLENKRTHQGQEPHPSYINRINTKVIGILIRIELEILLEWVEKMKIN